MVNDDTIYNFIQPYLGRFKCKDENFALKLINQERVNTQLENPLTLICIKFKKSGMFCNQVTLE